MTHETARELASAWVDDELPGLEAGALSAHLDACAECRAYVGMLRGLSPSMAAVPRLGTPDLAERVNRAVDSMSAEARRRQPWRSRLVPVLAAAVVVFVVAGLALRPGDVLAPGLVPVPVTAGVAELTSIRSLYVERTVVRTPEGEEGRRSTVEEKTWWVSPGRIRVESRTTSAGGVSTSLRIRDGSAEYVEVDGRATYTRIAPGLDAIPEPLSAGVAVLGRPTGAGPVVAGRPTTRYELEVEGARRVALVDTERYAVLGGDESFVLSKEVAIGPLVVESRTTRVLRVNPDVDESTFAVPAGAPRVVGDFRARSADDLDIAPAAFPAALDVVGSGSDSSGRETLLFQRGAFQVLVTSYLPVQQGSVEVRAALVNGRPAVLRVPLYGLPSITFTPAGVTLTVTTLLPPRALTQLAEAMYAATE